MNNPMFCNTSKSERLLHTQEVECSTHSAPTTSQAVKPIGGRSTSDRAPVIYRKRPNSGWYLAGAYA